MANGSATVSADSVVVGNVNVWWYPDGRLGIAIDHGGGATSSIYTARENVANIVEAIRLVLIGARNVSIPYPYASNAATLPPGQARHTLRHELLAAATREIGRQRYDIGLALIDAYQKLEPAAIYPERP